jgi:hypothetical protein
MRRTVVPENSDVENRAHAQADAGTTSDTVLCRRRVRYFKRSDGWFNRAVRLATVVHEGFWLGFLSADDLNAITADHYDHSQESASPEHNQRGLLDWELSAVNRHFHAGSRILVAAAGGGREVLALRRAGYTADGFDCNPNLVEASGGLFEQLGESRGVILCPPDQAPPGPPIYSGLIVGWSAYTHIPTRARRVAFLQALRQRALPGSPLLLSFFARAGSSRYDTLVYRVAMVSRFVFRGRKEALEVGDHLNWSYSHWFTREEMEAELSAGGFRMVHFGEPGEGHAVGIVE